MKSPFEKKIKTIDSESTIYKELAELLPQTIFEINTEGHLTFGNLNGLRMFGYDMDDFKKGLNVIDMIVPSERQKAVKDISRIIAGDKSRGTEYTAIRKDGTTFSIVIYATPIIKNKQPVGLRGIIIDVTDRKRIEEELKESEHRFRNITEKSIVGIYLIQGNLFTYVNSRFAEIFGYQPDEIIGKISPKEIVYKNCWDYVNNKIQQRLSNEVTSANYEFKGLTKNNKIIEVEVYGVRTTIKGEPAIIGSLIDVTVRKNAENMLKSLTSKYEKILQTAADGFHIVNEDGMILQINPAFSEMTGFSAKELTEININDIYLNDSEPFLSKLKKHLECDNSSHLFEARLKRKDDTIIDVEVSVNSLHHESEFLLFLSVRNISERKLANQKIKQLSRAVEQSPVSVIITNKKGTIEYVNPGFCALTGYSLNEVLGKTPALLKSGEQSEDFYKEMWSSIYNDKEWKGELHNKKKNGELFWELVSISPIKDNDGEITHFLAIKEDITKRKQDEKELKNAKEQAEVLNRLKSSFLANMNHELRTPLIGILGFADILHDELGDPEQKEMANTILQSGQRLLECLNMILDLSRLESDPLEFEFKPLNISGTVRHVAAAFAPVVKSKKLFFSVIIKDNNLCSRVDEKVLTQVLRNLLNNAIKFTSTGGIIVEVSSEPDVNGCYNIIKVTDTGIGIRTDEQKIIFEEFRQAKEGFNRPYEGTGLGLTITKKFVELMGGTISVMSEVGKGSTFTIRFPSLKQAPKTTYVEPEKSIKEKSFNKPVILSVENDPSSVKIIQYFLKSVCRIENAESGEEALKLIKRNRYHAVLMDINLGSGISGIDAVKEIKKYPHCKNTPIIAVTAYAYQSDKEKFLKEGCTHYLSKPFDRRTLVDLMTRILDN